MAIESTINRVQYAITASSTAPLTIPFRYDEPSWINVFYVADGSQTVQTLVNGADYSLSGSGTDVEGKATLDSSFLATVSNGALTIFRYTPASQDLNLTYNGRFPAELAELALDQLTMEVQDRDVNPGGLGSRAVMFPQTEPDGNPNVLDIPENRKNKVWGGDANGRMSFLNSQALSNLVLGYLGGPPTTADYLEAISAVQPIRLLEPPDETIGGQGGQLAYIPYIPSGVRGFGAADDKWNKTLLFAGYGDGGRPIFSDTGIPISLNDGLYYFGALSMWVYDINANTPNAETGNVPDTAMTPSQITEEWEVSGIPGASGIEGLQFEAISGSPGRMWWNAQESNKPPVWVEIILETSFLNLPTVDPEVPGKLFLDGTVLNVSQG